VARIHDLIRQVAAQAPDLARDLEREVDVLSERRAFGLNFERHTPEEVELPGRPVRRGDKVHVLPPRGETPKAENSVMWVVESIDRAAGIAAVGRVDPKGTVETRNVALVDLVVVAEFRDPIYPGLVSTGSVKRGGDKPYQSVINGENFHALQTLIFTHRGKVDVIYIDPPYNTGARDWKYNNDYVESDDQYRHSKWLAFPGSRSLNGLLSHQSSWGRSRIRLLPDR
jgi:adenine-specific DNA-methyltransferase